MLVNGEEKRRPTFRHFFLDFVKSFRSLFFGNIFSMFCCEEVPSSTATPELPPPSEGASSLYFVSVGGKIGVEETCLDLIELRWGRVPIRPVFGGDVSRSVVYIFLMVGGSRCTEEEEM
jgi:hypothetical protein